MRSGWALAVLAAVAVLPAGAQAQTMDARWLPWVGCWQPVAQPGTPTDLLVCISPQTSGTGVEIATVTGGQTVSTRAIVADGQRHTTEEEGCTGWQTAQFSSDGRRAYLRSESVCDGMRQSASAIMAMSDVSEWIDAQSLGMADERVTRILRYTPAPESMVRSAGLVPPGQDRVGAILDARLLAAADLSLADVQEAAGAVESDALEAYLIERGQQFDVDADRLVQLANAGVSASVIDVLVAVSYPERFAIDSESMTAEQRPYERAEGDRYGRYDPFGWGYYGGRYYNRCYGSYYSRYGYCDPYYYGYGYGGFGYGFYDPWYWGYRRPIIIVRGDGDDFQQPRGRVVNGRGYTRGGATDGGSPSGGITTRRARPVSSATESRGGTRYTSRGSSGGSSGRAAVTSGGYTRGGSSASGSSSGSSSGSAAGSSGSSGSSSGRTAKARSGGK
jgi:hypothetical protein